MHKYIIISFHPESRGIIIYIFPKDGSGKGIVLNINHDIVCGRTAKMNPIKVR